jgi:hypothetical protein
MANATDGDDWLTESGIRLPVKRIVNPKIVVTGEDD